MAQRLHELSLDENNRRFVPDEVFETVEEAAEAFLPFILPDLSIREIWGVCLADHTASIRVLEKCEFEKTFEGMDNYQGDVRRVCRYRYQSK